MRVAVTGSHGLIGSALLPALEAAGHEVRRVVRSAQAGPGAIAWNPEAGTIDRAALEGTDAMVHLAGAGIADHRWTERYKAQIRESRTGPTRLVASALASLDRRPAVLLSGSAIGWYGPRGDEVLDEASARGQGFLSGVTQAWEDATAPAEQAGIRTVHLRTGVVLSPKGGALAAQLPLFRFGLGGRMGSGAQWVSWISLDDEVAAIVYLLGASVRGPVNLTAPRPVVGAEFATTLGRVLGRPAGLPAPSFALRLGLGRELADTLLLSGQRVQPTVLLERGFAFRHPELGAALRSLLASPSL
jgi:uncharacterized protein (TIGR01777 family)